MKRKAELGTVLYLTALVLWLSLALVRYTYFKDYLPTDLISRIFCTTAQALLLYKLTLDFEFKWQQAAGLFLLVLFMTIAWAGGSLQFATMFALVYGAKNVPFENILKTSFAMQMIVFISTVFASQTGTLEDYIWEATTRQRHGLGFTHCMLASHFGLFLSLIYIAMVKKMTWLRAVVILAANGVLYYFTDGRTDFYLSILFVILAFVAGNLNGRLKGEKIWAALFAVLPFVLFGISVAAAFAYDEQNEIFLKLNQVLNNRFVLGQRAIEEYGFTLFGQKIKWIGASNLYYSRKELYNYVDNSYLMMSLTYGVIFVIGYCLAMGYVLYKKTVQKETMLVVCLLIILAFGVINPQSMYLTYNPFLALLALAWNPSGTGEKKYE